MSRRTISCPKCGFMQRKRDETCERCGTETDHSKRRTITYLFRICLSLLVAVGFYFYMSRVIHGMAN